MAKAEGAGKDFRGKKGNSIYYKVKGKTYAKEVSEKEPKERTPLQKLYISKFSQTNTYLSRIKEVIDFGFQDAGSGMKFPIDVASGQVMNNAFREEPGRFVLQPEDVLISMGVLTGPNGGSVRWIEEDSSVLFEWEDNSGMGSAKSTDRALLLLYNAEDGKSFYVLQGNRRKEGKMEIGISFPQLHKGKLHAYMAFSAFNRGRKKYKISNSVYLGLI
ncbi:DUF6266 family protein [Litoribacter populi]|uniref:DUF6266 family protein n=1 Tax=Litoribacter populi TaxID=2598460 RepID=UPI001181026F|nr:DUF6266 family protein [Litoribacter populi]